MLLTTLYNNLEKHPEIGVLSGLSGWVVGHIDSINLGTDILKFIGTGLGVGIAVLTLWIKIIELRKKKSK